MNTHPSCILVFVFFAQVLLSHVYASGLTHPSARVAGESYSFASNALQGQRQIDVYLPESYHHSHKHYPVIYVMDSDFLFDLTLSVAKNRWSRDLAPESIIVGIRARTNQERFDFAMPMKRENATISFEHSQPEKMAKFFKDELASTMDSAYRTNGFRLVIGMSPTATNVIHDYLSDEPFFDAHIAIAADLQFKTLSDVPLHLAIAEKAKASKRGFIMLSRASTDISKVPSRALSFGHLIALPQADKLGIYSFLPEETEHYSVALKSIDYALEKLFPMPLWRPNYHALRNADDPVSVLSEFYDNLDKTVGYSTYPKVDGYWMGNSVLGLARHLGRNEKLPQALDVLLWANQKLPDNTLLNHYLSRVNYRLGEQEAALRYAKHAVALAKERQDGDLATFESNLNAIKSTLSEQ